MANVFLALVFCKLPLPSRFFGGTAEWRPTKGGDMSRVREIGTGRGGVRRIGKVLEGEGNSVEMWMEREKRKK